MNESSREWSPHKAAYFDHQNSSSFLNFSLNDLIQEEGTDARAFFQTAFGEF